jgi:hypothetical protein
MRKTCRFWLPRHKCLTSVMALGIAAVSFMHSPVAMAAPFTHDCGIATCSVYLTRNTTKELCERLCQYSNASTAFIGVVAGAACFPLGGVGSLVCGGAAGIFGGFFIDKLDQATQKGQCLRIRYIPRTLNPIGLYADGSHFCHD